MRKLIATLLLIVTGVQSFACEVCERNKANALQGITHGSGPQSNWDYVVVIAMTIIALLTLFYSVKWLINPGEKNIDHIKYSFLNQE